MIYRVFREIWELIGKHYPSMNSGTTFLRSRIDTKIQLRREGRFTIKIERFKRIELQRCRNVKNLTLRAQYKHRETSKMIISKMATSGSPQAESSSAANSSKDATPLPISALRTIHPIYKYIYMHLHNVILDAPGRDTIRSSKTPSER